MYQRLRIREKTHAHPASSFWRRDKGFDAPPPEIGMGPPSAAPPPPRKGFAIRPKFSGDDAAAFCAAQNIEFSFQSNISLAIYIPRAWSSLSLTACNCASNFWFWTDSLRSASCNIASRFCIRSLRARSLRSAMPASFLRVEFWSTSWTEILSYQ